jgi:hypothetical protein
LDNTLEEEERIKIFIEEENKKNIKVEDKLGNSGKLKIYGSRRELELFI